jgi:hypothetical protein
MRRVIVAFAVWVVAVSPVWAACGGSSPNWTSTADYASLSACVDGASAGDTITVTGNATWEGTLEWTGRGVTLIGSGNPTITGGQTLFYWIPDAAAQAAHDTFKISGFTLDGNDANMGGAGIVRVYNPADANHVNLVLLDNTIRDIAPSGRGLYLTGRIYGVASGNVFDKVSVLVGAYGRDAVSWANDTQAYGVAQNFYFENNTVQFASDMTGYIGWMESGQGGRIVVRYNDYDYSNISDADELWDAHGLQGPQPYSGITGCQQYSTMVTEYYGNRIIDAVAMNRWQAHRGGWMLMFYNAFTGTVNGGGVLPVHVMQYYCDACQETGAYVQHVNNTYFWRNLSNGTESAAVSWDPCADPCGCTAEAVENTNFYNYAASFNGTVGAGCGTLAERPATCATGVGYWATNQSCSSLAGMVGANPSTPISGTLYKCTATDEWTPYYTPYTYPHPLTGSAVPNAPTNVRIR